MARKSPVGENVKLETTCSTRNMSTIELDGRSHVRTVESNDAETIHRPSGLKVFSTSYEMKLCQKQFQYLTRSVMRFLWPQNSRTIFCVSKSITRIPRSSQATATRSLSKWCCSATTGDSSSILCKTVAVLKSQIYGFGSKNVTYCLS